MARQALLLSVKWLKNHGLSVKRSGAPPEFFRPAAMVPVSIAARALGSNEMMVYRLLRSGALRAGRDGKGKALISLGGLRAVRRRWRELGKKTTHLEAAS